ncbi:MAG: tetratricopeptide repeat protein, partial [Candidatus Eisenbacteria bacterium]|nr:tetratricopeptide repeat protein [Candidatus Eisenbacteria bacterium]
MCHRLRPSRRPPTAPFSSRSGHCGRCGAPRQMLSCDRAPAAAKRGLVPGDPPQQMLSCAPHRPACPPRPRSGIHDKEVCGLPPAEIAQRPGRHGSGHEDPAAGRRRDQPRVPSKTESARSATRTSLGAKLALILMGIALSLLLLGGAELVLTVIDYGPPRDLFLTARPYDTDQYRINRRLSEMFFPPWASKPGFYEHFPAEKPPGTLRIFATGASSTLGDPFGPQAAFPALLEGILADVAPEREYQMANCGVIAISSLDVLKIHKQALEYDPDFVLIYCGHNEAYGADGVDSPVQRSFSSRWLAKAWLEFRNLRLMHLGRDLMARFAPERGPDDPSAEGFGMWLMRDHLVPACSEKHERLLDLFRGNILEMLTTARDAGVDVVLCTLISNLRGQSPMGSVPGCDATEEDRQRLETILERARGAMARGEDDAGLAILREARAVDDGYAEVHFRIGRCLEALGDTTAALEAYTAARDYDAVHFRACSDENRVLREIAAAYDPQGKHRFLFVDLERRLYEDFPHGPGLEFFTEHVHPYPQGHFWIAQEIARALAASELAPQFGAWHLDRMRTGGQYLVRIGMSNVDIAAGLYLTDRFKLAKWPFTQCYDNAEMRGFLQGRLDQLVAGFNPVEQQLYASIPSDTTGRLYDFGARHYVMADTYRGRRQGREALREILIARRYWWPMVFVETDLALILAAMGRPQDAEAALHRARRLDPDYPAISFVAGTLHHARGRLPQAAQAFQTYLQQEPRGRYS